jgi:MFS family permease
MVSFALWSHRPIATANGVGLLSGMALMGLTTFVPIYVQIVLHRSPVVAGLALTTMLVGWPAGATLAARLFHRFGLHQLLLTGALLLPLGAALFVLLTPQSSPVIAGVGSLTMGFGMGLLSVSSLVLIQEIVDWSQRGSATASNLFSRNLGSTLGATVLGAVLNHGLTQPTGGLSVTSDQLRQLIELPTGSAPGDAVLRIALQHSLNLTFWAMLAITVIVVAIAFLVPAVEIRQATPVTVE